MVEDLRAKDRIKETFGKFIDPRIVANLINPAGGKDLAERQVATVFFRISKDSAAWASC